MSLRKMNFKQLKTLKISGSSFILDSSLTVQGVSAISAATAGLVALSCQGFSKYKINHIEPNTCHEGIY